MANLSRKQPLTPSARGLISPRNRLGSRLMLGHSGKEEKFGVAVLTALSIAGLHSAICPSYFTAVTFGTQPEARGRAMEGLWISLGLSTVASVAIYAVWKEMAAAITAQVTAFALFGIGVYAINREAPKTIPPIEQQNTQGIPQQTVRQSVTA